MVYSVESTQHALRVNFPPRLAWPAVAFYVSVFALLLVIAITFSFDLTSVPSIAWWVAVLTAMPLLYFSTFREELRADCRTVTITRSTLGFIRWHQHHPIEDIRWVRPAVDGFSEDELQAFAWLRMGGSVMVALDGRTHRALLGPGPRQVAFNVGTRTYWTGPGLSDADADDVAAALRQWVHANQKEHDPTWT